MIVHIDTWVRWKTRFVRCFDAVAVRAEFETSSSDGKTDSGIRNLVSRWLCGTESVSEDAKIARL